MATRSNPRKPFKLLPVAAVLLAVLSGCAVVPHPVGEAEVSARVNQDLTTLFKDVPPLSGELGLHEAFARALKYNFDYRLRAMEQTMTSAQLDVAKFDMLPRLTLAAGYNSRSNDSGSRSVDFATGTETRTFTGGQERNRHTESAVLAWNVLDFGVSYVRAQQQTNQVLIAEERKRKVVQNISQDVRQAFWRAYGAQKALPRLDDLLNRVKEAVVRSKRIEKEGLMPPLQALAFQRSLLDLHQQIVSRRQELVLAQTELAALINLRPGSVMTLTSGGEELAAQNLQPMDDLDALDQAALKNRPELREEDYRKKISVLEARRAMLSLLPGIDLSFANSHDSNKFLFHNTWSELSGNISFNLIRAFSYPAHKKAAEVQQQLDDTRRVALSMAVLAQVRLAAKRYSEAKEDYLLNVQTADIDARIEKSTADAAKATTESEMELLRTEVRSALSDMQRYVSLANLQTAYARVANTVGADLLPDVPASADLSTFAGQLAQADASWRKTSFHTGAAPDIHPPVSIGNIELASDIRLDLKPMLRDSLKAHGLQVVDGDATSISATSSVGEVRAGVRSVEIIWSVKRGDQVLGTVPYRSVISGSVASSWAIFGASATESAAAKIASLLKADAARSARGMQKAAQ